MPNKMDWLIEKYKANKCEYLIKKSGRDFGTVCMPTGVGKSGVMFEDAIYTIFKEKLGTSTRKLILNFSAPILKLNQQNINDFIYTLTEIWPDELEKPGFFINSSDNGKNYSLSDFGVSAISFNKFDTTSKDINIIVSCHKSMQKFINKVSSLQEAGNEYFIINYIDESHLLTIDKDSSSGTEENAVRIDFEKLLDVSNRVYAISATPEKRIVDMLNRKEGISPQAVRDWLNDNSTGKSPWVIFQAPIEAIHENKILPTLITITKVPSDISCITPAIAERYMDTVKERLPNIYHKILITCKSCDDLLSLRGALEADGYKVFSTNSKTGFGIKEEDPDVDDKTIIDFTNEVDNYKGDCFVLHIRQLIQGIDITSLTDTIMFCDATLNIDKNRHIIQTNGRTLRYGKDENGKSERGKPAKDCKKPYGSMLFVIPEDNTETEDAIKRLINNYYGYGASIFESKYNDYKRTKDNTEINFNVIPCYSDTTSSVTPIIIKALEELKNAYGPMLEIAKKSGNNIAYVQLKRECDKKASLISGITANTVDWLTNDNVKKEIYEKVPSIFGIDSIIWRQLVS